MLGLIGLSAAHIWGLERGIHMTAELAGLALIPVRTGELSLPFAVVFHIAAALNVIYALHEEKRRTLTAGFAYAGAAIARALCR